MNNLQYLIQKNRLGKFLEDFRITDPLERFFEDYCIPLLSPEDTYVDPVTRWLLAERNGYTLKEYINTEIKHNGMFEVTVRLENKLTDFKGYYIKNRPEYLEALEKYLNYYVISIKEKTLFVAPSISIPIVEIIVEDDD